MQIALVQFPGSNCERETMLAIKRAGMTPVEFLWNEPIDKLIACDGYVIVGGFSYEDRCRAGALAALDPLMQVIKTQSEKGKPVLGICNGAQILVESGLIPGLNEYAVGMALTDNKRIQQGKVLGTGYYNAWVNLKLSPLHQKNAFTRYLTPKSILKVPVAHAEGRFVMPMALLDAIHTHGLAVFQYCNEQGEILDEFPVNPNGSLDNLAAISNQAGNVLAIMPHPERTLVGDPLFHSMRDYIAEGAPYQPSTLFYTPECLTLNKYIKPAQTSEWIIELIITDNHAKSVESSLRKKGLPVTVSRQIHWEIECQSESMLQKIQDSGLLYNERKEFRVNVQKRQPHQRSFLVRPKEDVLGLEKMQQLKRYFAVEGLTAIRHGVLWHVMTELDVMAAITPVLFNPSSHECFHYD